MGAPRGAIPEDEHLAPALVAQAHKLVTSAVEEAGEVEIPRFEHGPVGLALGQPVQVTLTASSKKELTSHRTDAAEAA